MYDPDDGGAPFSVIRVGFSYRERLLLKNQNRKGGDKNDGQIFAR